jgi:hypothetical protein
MRELSRLGFTSLLLGSHQAHGGIRYRRQVVFVGCIGAHVHARLGSLEYLGRLLRLSNFTYLAPSGCAIVFSTLNHFQATVWVFTTRSRVNSGIQVDQIVGRSTWWSKRMRNSDEARLFGTDGASCLVFKEQDGQADFPRDENIGFQITCRQTKGGHQRYHVSDQDCVGTTVAGHSGTMAPRI